MVSNQRRDNGEATPKVTPPVKDQKLPKDYGSKGGYKRP